ncbi:MAG: hypothetical protein ABL984_00580 [Pyrinomonadaceae bacterium]
MKNLLTLIVTLVLFVLVGCGGGGTSSGGGGPVDYSGTWAGPFSGDLAGTITAVVEPSGTVDLSGTANGVGPFSGDGWINPESGAISGDLGSLGKFSGAVRIAGGVLVGTVNLPNAKRIEFQLARR